MPSGRGFDIAVLMSWLVTEALGCIMLRGWLARGGSLGFRRRPGQAEGMALPVLAGHVGLNLAGLLFWILFLLSGAKVLAWLALGFLAPAVGLGISTVTIWTPYPGGSPEPDEQSAVVPD